MHRSFLLAVILFSSGQSFASPVSMLCNTSSDNNETYEFEVTADEKTHNIAHKGKSEGGRVFSTDGVFSVGELSYKDVRCSSGACFIDQFTINRVDLSVMHLWKGEAVDKSLGVAPREIIRRGSCTIIDVPERKF
ncbi:hypothetical protein [Thiocystis minor]|uniref:hypothetical protein n=1 Tax=Thiocystis minor TaxID=61597 RepID=UPI00191206E8|nr:hypothetical protein [Thiocystis minor]